MVRDDITAPATRKMFNDPGIGKGDYKYCYGSSKGEKYGNVGVTGESDEGFRRTIRR